MFSQWNYLSKCTLGRGEYQTLQALGHKVQVDIDTWRPAVIILLTLLERGLGEPYK